MITALIIYLIGWFVIVIFLVYTNRNMERHYPSFKKLKEFLRTFFSKW